MVPVKRLTNQSPIRQWLDPTATFDNNAPHHGNVDRRTAKGCQPDKCRNPADLRAPVGACCEVSHLALTEL